MHKLLIIILRPVVWGLCALLIAVFGRKFYQKLLNAISVFLAIISVGGVVISTKLMNDVIEAGRHASTDDISLCIVAVVMTVALIICTIGYMLLALTISKASDKEAKKFAPGQKEKILKLIDYGPRFLGVFCFMGFSIPLILMEETAGKIVGGLIEAVSVVVLIILIISVNRGDNK